MNKINELAQRLNVSPELLIAAFKEVKDVKRQKQKENYANLDYEHIRTMIADRLDWDAPKDQWEWMTATGALRQVGMLTPRNVEAKAASFFLQKNHNAKTKRSKSERLLLVPPARQQ